MSKHKCIYPRSPQYRLSKIRLPDLEVLETSSIIEGPKSSLNGPIRFLLWLNNTL